MAAQILRQTVQFLRLTVSPQLVDQEDIGVVTDGDRRNVGKIDMADSPKSLPRGDELTRLFTAL